MGWPLNGINIEFKSHIIIPMAEDSSVHISNMDNNSYKARNQRTKM